MPSHELHALSHQTVNSIEDIRKKISEGVNRLEGRFKVLKEGFVSGIQAVWDKISACFKAVANCVATPFRRAAEFIRTATLSPTSTPGKVIKVVNFVPHLVPMEIEKNTATIIDKINEITAQHDNENEHLIIHTPEMSLTAYDCGDLFQVVKFNRQIEDSLEKILKVTNNVSVTVGFPYYTTSGKRVILHALISKGEIKLIKGKEELANNIGTNRGVEYENRYFVPCEAGTQINLLNQLYTYEKGKNSIFSDGAVEIEGKKVSLAICEEIFTGTDLIGAMNRDLDAKENQLIKEDAGDEPMTHDKYCELKNNFDRSRLSKEKDAWEKKIKDDIKQNSMLFKQLKKSDIILVPNGSPSATGKIGTRGEMLKLVGEAYREEMGIDEEKLVYYINHNGPQGGSISYDGTTLEAKINKEGVSVNLLNAYHYGIATSDVPHWATEEGQEEIAKIINNTPYYSGKTLLNIKFGHQTRNIYPKIYQEAEYAYSNLLKHLEAFPKGSPLKPNSKHYSGFYISQSGGFDSAHTAIIRAKAFELRLRGLVKETGSVENSLETMIDELRLEDRPFHREMFLARFRDDEMQKLNLEGVKTVADLLRLNKGLDISLLTKLIVFHLVKASYLRTDNNSIKTETAARSLAQELGIDFDVRNVDVDFKTALLLESGIDLNAFTEEERINILSLYTQILNIGKKSDRLDQIAELEARKEIHPETERDVDAAIAHIKMDIAIDEQLFEELRQELYTLVHPDNVSLEKFKVHNWLHSATGLEIENIQARVRAAKNWEIAYQYGLMPTSNPNTDEGKQGYTTYIGDLHAGKESSTAGLRKIEILAEMAYLMKAGLKDPTQFAGEIKPIKSIVNTFGQPPSAELQQVGNDSKFLFSQQTDEDSYGMSYFELSLVGDQLFKLSENGAHFVSMAEVYEHLKDHLLFHGHSPWTIYSKIDKVYRQWFFAAFKRRAAPWQMTNPDVSVDHHANNRTEFAGIDNAIKWERADLLLKLLHEQGMIQGDLQDLRKNLYLNPEFQNMLQGAIWSNQDPKDLKVLIKRYAEKPELLNAKIQARLKPYAEAIREPELTKAPEKCSNGFAGAPLEIKARDMAGNVFKAKQAIADAYAKGDRKIIIPDIVGSDLGDNLRRVHSKHIDLMLHSIADYAKRLDKDLVVVVGHPSYDEKTEDRSKRYYQSASVLKGGEVVKTFHANAIDNNNDKPGASYDTRTFQPYREEQISDGVGFFVLIGQSKLPDNVKAPVIHIGSLSAEDQLRAIEGIPEKQFALSVNAIGNPSGLRCFNGRIIDKKEQVAAYRKEDRKSSAILEYDARWLKDYLPPIKTTISLDSPEALYTLAVRKKAIELMTGKPCDSEAFTRYVDVVTPYFTGEEQNVLELWQAAEEILGFSLPKADDKHLANQYCLDSFRHLFLRNTLLGDINMKAFASIKKEDTWFAFERGMQGLLEGKGIANPAKEDLRNSQAFKASLQETYRREKSPFTFEEYYEKQIELIMERIKNYRQHPETDDRLRSIFAWLLSARDGGEGQIILSNIARNDLTSAKQDLFGGRIHAGGVSVTAHRSLKEMQDAINSPLASQLLEQKATETLVTGLTRKDADAIYELLREHNFDTAKIDDKDKLKHFAALWKTNNWDRHAIPNSPHTDTSIDQQTSFREPLNSDWLNLMSST